MPINPCRQCRMVDQDKNNAVCLNCEERIRYVACLEAAMGFTRCSLEESGFSPLHLPSRGPAS